MKTGDKVDDDGDDDDDVDPPSTRQLGLPPPLPPPQGGGDRSVVEVGDLMQLQRRQGQQHEGEGEGWDGKAAATTHEEEEEEHDDHKDDGADGDNNNKNKNRPAIRYNNEEEEEEDEGTREAAAAAASGFGPPASPAAPPSSAPSGQDGAFGAAPSGGAEGGNQGDDGAGEQDEEEVIAEGASRQKGGSGSQQGRRKRTREEAEDASSLGSAAEARRTSSAGAVAAASVVDSAASGQPHDPHSPPPHQHQHGHVHVGLAAPNSSGGGDAPGEPSISTASASGSNPQAAASPSSALDLSHFYEAMAMMNPTERRGWDEAQSRCSAAVLEHECCPCYFLRANQHNPWDAAAMACSYWNERITLFRDRAFDPLTIGGGGNGSLAEPVQGGGPDDSGAATAATEPTGLSREEVDILETGCMQLLPSDAEGRSVLYLDRSLLPPDALRQTTVPRLRVLWYLFQKAYTSQHKQAHKIVVIGLVCRPPNGGYDFSFPARGFRIASSLPIHIETYHLLTLPAVSGTGRMLKTVLAVCAGMLGMYFQSQTQVHHGATPAMASASATAANGAETEGPNDPESSSSAPPADPRLQLLEKLRTYGLDKQGLPECAGGTFTLESFKNWLQKQRTMEQHQLCGTSEQRCQRKREINRVHSRQKRLRRRQEFQELLEQAQALERDNERARQVHSQLEAVLFAVHHAITTNSSSHGVPAAAYSPMTASSSDSSSTRGASPSRILTGLPPRSLPQQQRPASRHDPIPDNHNYTRLLAALEPDPIAPYHHNLHQANNMEEWEPDPIAPSCDPRASSSSSSTGQGNSHADDLKRLSRALAASWHGQAPEGAAPAAHPQEHPGGPADGLSGAATYATADSVPSRGFAASFPHMLPQQGASSMDARLPGGSGLAASVSSSHAAAEAASSYPDEASSSSSNFKVPAPAPSSALQSFFPFFYKSNPADPQPSQQHQEPAPTAAPVPSTALSTEHDGPFSQYWTLYASNANVDGELPSLSPAAAAAPEDPDPNPNPSQDEPLHRFEKWDDGNGGGLFSLLKSDGDNDSDAFEPLDHRIAWDQFV